MIAIEDLRFQWNPEETVVLKIEELSILDGERVFVEGPSGCGKTTLLNILSGIAQAGSGVVSVLGHDLTIMTASERDAFRADNVGVIFQMFNLLPYLSMVENVALPCRFSGVRNQRATRRSANAEREAERLLNRMGLSSETSRPVSRLSVGQQQRVAAARALIGTPELVVADEPTSALDGDAREAFLDLLLDECRESGATLVFVSHDTSLAERFDRRISLPEINRAP